MKTRSSPATVALVVLSIALVVAAAPVSAAPPSDEPIESAAGTPCSVGITGGAGDLGSVLLRVLVQCRQELGVTDAQLERVDRLALELARGQIQRRADLQIATLELAVLLETDPADPARPADAAAAETRIRDAARIAADGEVAQMRMLESLKAVLTAEQRIKLAALMDDPPEAARTPGGGAPGGGRPPGGHPPGGGGPGGGAPPRPHPPGGGTGHPRPPDHRFDGRHYGHLHPWISVRPWVWYEPFWPGYVYPAPPAYPYPAPAAYWYYCSSAAAYYPYVETCPEGWVTVVPRAAAP